MLLACLQVSPQEGSVHSGLSTMLSALVYAAQSRVKWISICSMDMARKWQGEPQRGEGGCGQNDRRWLLLSCLLEFIWLLCSSFRSLRRANSTGDQQFSPPGSKPSHFQGLRLMFGFSGTRTKSGFSISWGTESCVCLYVCMPLFGFSHI